MLFHTFFSQNERRRFGGSDFIELQYCRLKRGTEIRKIVSVNSIDNWKDDSLYISGNDVDVFLSSYGEIFNGGIYNNGKCGFVDLCGINYYSKEQTAFMIEVLKDKKPMDFQILLQWLENSHVYNGFYVLGV